MTDKRYWFSMVEWMLITVERVKKDINDTEAEKIERRSKRRVLNACGVEKIERKVE